VVDRYCLTRNFDFMGYQHFTVINKEKVAKRNTSTANIF
jgi:hypothetical protein